MRKVVNRMLCLILQLILKLRYRIEVRGAEVLDELTARKKGVLILPNHPAEVDPFILLMLLSKKFDARPLVVEKFFYYKGARFFMKLVRAKPVAEFDKAVTDYKKQGAEKLYYDVVADLKSGAHILLYPGSGLKRDAEERLGGRSLAYRTLQDCEDAEILLVRISGLWGSMFSVAQTGESPDFWQMVRRGIAIVFKNGFFFTPKRKVLVEFSLQPAGIARQGSRWEFNQTLEQWYNQYPKGGVGSKESEERVAKEPLALTRYYFWSKKEPHPFCGKSSKARYQDLFVPSQVRQDIIYQLSLLSGKAVNEIHDEDDLVYDVGLDSLNVASLYAHVDATYGFAHEVQPGDLKTVEDLFAAAVHVKQGQSAKKESVKKDNSSWPKERHRPRVIYPDGENIIEMFLRNSTRMGKAAACYDGNSGVLTYKAMRRAVVILANKIKDLEGDYIGVMLPSSVGVYIIILAILLAKKVPVPINWTVGPYFTNHAVDLMEIKHVLTSRKFIDRLDNVDLGAMIDKLLFMEDLRQSLTIGDKIKGALLAKRSSQKILARFGVDQIAPDDTAIVLFTSGTTALPKAVPLTHRNLVGGQKALINEIVFSAEDVFIMPLPPFHIFGLNVSLLPLLMGIKIVFTPDPLDSTLIAREILKWHVSVITLAPTFFTHLFRTATLSQLKSLRFFFSGAEKAQPQLIDYIRKLGDVFFIEGYGLTETSPLLAKTSISGRSRGVGKVPPGIDLIIRDPDSGELLDKHQIGEICAAGDPVFQGYYKQDNQEYFIQHQGKNYYRTGDLGYFDEYGNLFLEGRLKLSFKRGGEMINASAIETALLEKAKEKGWVPQDINHPPFACVPKEVPQGSTKIVLFSEVHISIEQVNNALLEAGFARLHKINEIIYIEEIPILKTGKIYYRKLFELVGNESIPRQSME